MSEPQIQIRIIEDLDRVTRLPNGYYNLRGADLRGAHLERANLRGYDFTGADFRGAHLTGINLTGSIVTGANFEGADVRGMRGGPNVINIARREQQRQVFQRRQRERESQEFLNNKRPTLPSIPALEPWVADESCEGQEDPVSLEPIPSGKGFKLDYDKEKGYNTCYDVTTLANMLTIQKLSRINRVLTSPLTRAEFSQNDLKRINNYIRSNLIGGNKKKIHKNKKLNKTKKNTKINKKRKSIRKIK